MASNRKSTQAKPAKKGPPLLLDDEVQAALAWLTEKSTKRDRENVTRFGISTCQHARLVPAGFPQSSGEFVIPPEAFGEHLHVGHRYAKELAGRDDIAGRVTS